MKPKLLIVDDDEEILKQLKWAFKEDFSIFLATDREAAIQSFQRHSPDLVALDLGLSPHMGGGVTMKGLKSCAWF